MADIELRNVHKSFGETKVLNGISLAIEAGEQVCLVGSSGTGKTVLTKLLLGLAVPDSGEIWLGGKLASGFTDADWRAWLATCGVVFQGSALFDSLTVCENVGIRLREHQQLPDLEIRKRVIAALAQVNLGADLLDLFPAALSGGMQKRVSIARAIIGAPRRLFFDEPTAGLDPANAHAIDELVRRLATAPGRSCFVVTHHPPTIAAVAQRVLLLEGGKIAYDGDAHAFLAEDSPAAKRWRGAAS